MYRGDGLSAVGLKNREEINAMYKTVKPYYEPMEILKSLQGETVRKPDLT